MRSRFWFFSSFFFLQLVGKVVCFEVNCGGPGIGAIVPDSPAFYGKTKGSVYQYADGDFHNDKFRTFSYAADGKDLLYSFNVYPGTAVNVTAEFSEIWSGAWFSTPRVMRLSIGGQVIKHHLNVWADAGNSTNPLSFSREFIAGTGTVEVRIHAVSGNAFISALDIQVVHAVKKDKSSSPVKKTKSADSTKTKESSPGKKTEPSDATNTSKSASSTKAEPDTKKETTESTTEPAKKTTKATTTESEITTANMKLTSATNLLKVNCGGQALAQGKVLKDNLAFYGNSPGYVGVYSQGDTHSDVYTSQSYGDKSSDLVYTFIVTRGATVTVVARFSEIYAPTKLGERLLQVSFNGAIEMDKLDVLAASKGLNKHFDVTKTFVSTNGFVEVRVKALKQNAMISGIDIKAPGLIRGAAKQKAPVGGNKKDDDDDDDDEDGKDDKDDKNIKKKSAAPKTNTGTGNTAAPAKKEPAATNPGTRNPQPETGSRSITPQAPAKSGKMVPDVIKTFAEINCGGPAIGENTYSDDMKYYKKSPGKVGMFIMGNAAASIYNSQSFGINGGEIVYSMYVPAGSRVRVVAKFMEIWSGAASKGFRTMDLTIGGVVRAKNLDVFTWAKGLRKELALERIYTVTGTEIQVRVKSVRQNAMISGISVQILPKAIEVNCGGPAIGKILADSKKFNGKSPAGVGNFMMGDAKTSIYNSQSFGINGGDLVYTFPVPKGSKVRVTAQFSEIWRGAASKGFRLLQLLIGGHVEANNIDVYTWAEGLRKKLTRTREYTVPDAEVEVRVKSIKQNAMLSGIVVEVLRAGPALATNPNASPVAPNTGAGTDNKAKAVPVTTGKKTDDDDDDDKKKADVKPVTGKKTVPIQPKQPVVVAPAPKRPLVLVKGKLAIDCGGPAIGGILADDKKYNFRSPAGVGVFTTEAPTKNVYHSQAYGLNNNALVYAVSVPVGSKVKVVAQFAEIWEGAAKQGFRVIEVFINGAHMAKNLDVWSAAGGVRIPYDIQRTFIVTGKPEVEVRITSVRENAMLSGLSVEILSPAKDVVPTRKEPVTAAVITKSLNINCGGPAIAAKKLVADADRFHVKSVKSFGTFAGANAATSEYGSQAFGKAGSDLVYTLTVPANSKVKVVAKFAEIWAGGNKANFRVMKVFIGGVLMADNLDVWKQAGNGLNKEYDVQRTFLANNPEVEIRIKSIKENAMLSGIYVEVFEFHAVPVSNNVQAIPITGTNPTTSTIVF